MNLDTTKKNSKKYMKQIKEFIIKEYCIEFDVKDKILIINKPVEVSVFSLIRQIAKEMYYKDIRVR